ncbi:Stk1 family PASTA domain-containing Ser/Thr kinase [Actinomyces urinae]|uniref:Stk1 family PASTA domain-containing Ser/Thr kinase n=1 Tax=Actinomyces urinae TaxID=1689268 RepID=UPI001E50C1BD|nr:Stk1 family PASTA domain-containing Ser/Thr kinase [Actinomyces urinae]
MGLFKNWREQVGENENPNTVPPPAPGSDDEAASESAQSTGTAEDVEEPEVELTSDVNMQLSASEDTPGTEDSASTEQSDDGEQANATTNSGAENEAPTLTDPLVGMVLDERYKIERLLARGGMATVYVAYDNRLERPVAIKVMHPHLAQSADYVNRFRKEARSAARIIHPAVVTVFDQGIIEGSGYLVMELVHGSNLRTLLNEEGALTLDRALAVTETVLQALSSAHRGGVIHRDIKPENVLVPNDGNLKVADFGLAGAVSDVSAASTGSVMGTVAYLAPELAAGEHADARSDLFSVGIMLYEILTGHTPFEDLSVYQIVKSYAEKDIPSPSELESWIPSEVDDFVCSLTARDRNDRPQSAAEALETLVRIRSQLPESLLGRKADIAPKVTSETTHKIQLRGETVALPVPASKPTTSVRTIPAAPKKSKRAPLVIATIITLLVAAGSGFTWWWFEYGPGSYIDVPAIAGANLKDGTAKLDALGIQSVVEEKFDDVVPAGIIIDTRPSSDERVHKAGIVTILLSKGIEMVEVPKLTNATSEELDQILKGAKLTRGDTQEAYDEEVEKGRVISQSVAPGESVKHDASIDVVISKGREPIKVPKVVGLTLAEASQLLSDAGLQVNTNEEFSNEVEKGIVISQTPVADETLYRADPVSIVVSKGPETVTIPNVIRMSEAEAKAALEELGLVVNVDRVFMLVDMVATVNPGVGTEVKVGSTVTIRVV